MTLSSRRPILGLLLADDQLTAILINGKTTPLTVTLTQDLLTGDPSLVAEELRERLAPLGKLPSQAFVGLPLNRLLIAPIEIPELPAEAVSSYLHLQAEREFLMPPVDMVLGISRHTRADGKDGALLTALATTRHANIQRSLKPLGIKKFVLLPTTALLADPSRDCGVIAAHSRSVDLAISSGGGIAMLRRLAGDVPGAQHPVPDYLAAVSELRISLRQAPLASPSFTIIGQAEQSSALTQEVGLATRLPRISWATPVADAPALIAARRAIELLKANEPLPLAMAQVEQPRQAGFWQRFQRRQLIATAAIAVLLIVAMVYLFINQNQQLADLERQWSSMAPRVDTVRATMAEAKELRPWLSDQPESLDLISAVTYAFPERGTVWVTRFELKDRHLVSIAGKATARDAWLKTLDQLRSTPGVTQLRVSQARDTTDGKSPMTFALSFSWDPPPKRTTPTLEEVTP